ncbi:MAG: ATP synthase F1 subunit delta [Bacteroidales bacterium]|nr:ATP synthase F1 subunit delta [Bacteroidales bacterium]
MNDGLIPRRYAKALLETAQQQGADKDTHIYDLTRRLIDSFASEPGLQDAVNNPFVTDADKELLLTTAAGADPKTDRLYADFLKLLAENHRLGMARDIAIAYAELYRQKHNIYQVTVTSAAPLAPDAAKRLKAMIEQHLKGAQMEYTSLVDPDLIGGLVVSVGNERLDASIANELKQLRLKLLSK